MAPVAVVLLIGFSIGGEAALPLTLLLASGTSLIIYWNADKLLLSMYDAEHVGANEAPELCSTVRRLSQQAGLPMPKIFVADDSQLYAFATGRNPQHASVCLSSELLSSLTADELVGVLAHELGHIQNRDTFAATIALLIRFSIGHEREFEADRRAAEISGRPLDVASALRRIAGATVPPQCAAPTSLFSTHPSIQERIARLEAMAEFTAIHTERVS